MYCLSKQAATEDFPFDETTLAFRVENKIFAIVDLENTEWFCVKCDADRAVELRDAYPQIKPAWHMNKRYWNMMDIERMDSALVKELIDHSYIERYNVDSPVRVDVVTVVPDGDTHRIEHVRDAFSSDVEQ